MTLLPCEWINISQTAQTTNWVEWDYLLNALSRFGFGPNFVHLTRLIYTDLTALIYTNSFSFEYFPLHRGTKQGDPVSPLLFILAIEPLVIALICNNSIRGISRAGLTHIVWLYADNLLLYITNSRNLKTYLGIN